MKFVWCFLLLLMALGCAIAAKPVKVKRNKRVRLVLEKWCVACGKKHSDIYWYTMGTALHVCRAAYRRINYAMPGSMPVSWAMYKFIKGVHRRDSTGCLCHSLAERHDLQALRQMYSILSQSKQRQHRTLQFAVFAAGFAISLYFAAPSTLSSTTSRYKRSLQSPITHQLRMLPWLFVDTCTPNYFLWMERCTRRKRTDVAYQH